MNLIAYVRAKGLWKRKKKRRRSSFAPRLDWDSFYAIWGDTSTFERAVRMKKSSFLKLVALLTPYVKVDYKMASLRGGAITPEVCVFITLRYLAGASYLDIQFYTGISRSHFYHVKDKTLRAIIQCETLQIPMFPGNPDECRRRADEFTEISYGQAIRNCVGALDGYLLRIETPSKKEAGNVRSYFSGHYQCHGVNLQGICDASSRFLYLCVTGPGCQGDVTAVQQEVDGKSIEDLLGELPNGYVVIGDAAYTASEQLVPIYSGSDAKVKKYDDFNYYASQLRIRIEMAFGLMQQKWGILKHPIRLSLRKIKYLVGSVARLHNFTINERLTSQSSADELLSEQESIIESSRRNQKQLYREPTPLDNEGVPIHAPTELVAPFLSIPGQSVIREAMVEQVKMKGLTRPLRPLK